jgi:hypothetical protein
MPCCGSPLWEPRVHHRPVRCPPHSRMGALTGRGTILHGTRRPRRFSKLAEAARTGDHLRSALSFDLNYHVQFVSDCWPKPVSGPSCCSRARLATNLVAGAGTLTPPPTLSPHSGGSALPKSDAWKASLRPSLAREPPREGSIARSSNER